MASSNIDDKLRLLESLVYYETTNSKSGMDLVLFIEEFLKKAGHDCNILKYTSTSKIEQANLLCVIGNPEKSGILFSGHMDVVSANEDGWESSPFRLTRLGNKLYGRGSVDMKGFLVAMLTVALELPKAKQLKYPIILSFSYDEEIGCVGVQHLLSHLTNYVAIPQLAVIGEPTSMKIGVAHKGKITFRVSVTGSPGHSAQKSQHVNAVEFAARLINHLEQIIESFGEYKSSSYAEPKTTFSIGKIRGGNDTVNITPDSCVFDAEIRNLPEVDAQCIYGKIKETAKLLEKKMQKVSPEAKISFKVLSSYPALCSQDSTIAASFLKDVGVGENMTFSADFGTEAGCYAKAGISSVVCGPGDISRAHKANEYITCLELEEGCQMLKNITLSAII